MLPALDRLPEIRRLVSQRRYFVVHAPRQTGKTTALKALVRETRISDKSKEPFCYTLEGPCTVQSLNGYLGFVFQVR